MKIRSRKQAKEFGAVKYFTGVACKRGHVAERYTVDGKCTMCKSELESSSDYRSKRIERDHHRYHSNPLPARTRSATYRANHIEEEKERRRRYYRENRERILNESKAYQAKAYGDKKTKRRWVPWTDFMAITKIYRKCAELNRALPNIGFRVAYIIPLAGRIVCGLHTADNLRIVSETFDLSSSNRFTYYDQEVESVRYLQWLHDRR